jgi:hypothetical protein
MGAKTKLYLVIILVVALLISMATPAMARKIKTSIEGSPELDATLVGNNEFMVGQDGVLQIMVHNNGTFSGEIEDPNDKVMAIGYTTQMGTILVPPCTTAVDITATLMSDVPSIEVLNSTVVIGTLPSGGFTVQPMAFQIRVDEDTRPGKYQLKLKLEYTYLENVRWLNEVDYPEYVDELQLSPYYEPEYEFFRASGMTTEYILLRIYGTHFSAQVIETEGVMAGATGIIAATIENSGLGEAKEVTAEIVPTSNFIPVDQKALLGDLGGGESSVVKFKVEVSSEAIAKISPLDIVMKYKDENDVYRQTQLTVGVPIRDKVGFEIQQSNPDIAVLNPGSEAVISVHIKNTGDSETRDVVARINAVDPFTSTDEISYVGTLRGGETGVAKFRISTDNDAVPKPYALNVVVKYWDAEGTSYTSKPMKVKLDIEQPVDNSTPVWQIVGIIAGVSAGLGYYFFNKRRKKSVKAEG